MSQQLAPHLIYCHGFASGPETTSKGRALREGLACELSSIQIPDLEGEDFYSLTMDGMAARLEQAIKAVSGDGAPLILAGSSLGAWLVAHAAASAALAVSGLLLVAPAFGFVSRWRDLLGDEGVAQWRALGQREFYHYRSASMRLLGVGFLDSCQGLPDVPAATALPTVVIHGRNDETAPWRPALEYVQDCNEAEFHLLNEGHSVDSASATDCLLDRARALIRRVQQ